MKKIETKHDWQPDGTTKHSTDMCHDVCFKTNTEGSCIEMCDQYHIIARDSVQHEYCNDC